VTTIDANALRDDCENGFQPLRCPNMPTRFKTSVRGDFFVCLSQGKSNPIVLSAAAVAVRSPPRPRERAISSHKHVRLEIQLRIPRS